jgi:NADH-quinone oxidoreductase subunit G
MVKVYIDEKEIEVPKGITIFNACAQNNTEVPHFCYHNKLSIAGNCRMCLVEVEGSPKPVASCAMPVMEGMKIHTKTEKVKKARKGVLELLLINHPLDCPICDQGGECDLQDLTLNYGPSSSRFDLNKRAVGDKYMGPLISTTMTRCIHCTRCVRFATEIGGVPELGSLGRGENMEITSYVQSAVTSELSGNMVDICPVGALNNKPYAYRGRPWDLTKIKSIDVMDAVGSHISIESKDNEILRILPKTYEPINEEWISDKTRHHFDGLYKQRLDTPYVRKNGSLTPCSFEEAFKAIECAVKGVHPKEIGAIAGDLADCESLFLLKELMVSLGSLHLDARPLHSQLSGETRCAYTFNSTIEGIENADALLLIGTNPREEATLINARIRKTWLKENIPIALVGPRVDLTYPYEHLGDHLIVLKDIVEGTSSFSHVLKSAHFPLIIMGEHVLTRREGMPALRMVQDMCEKYGAVHQKDPASSDIPWNGFNVLSYGASRVGAMDIGFYPLDGGMDAHDMLHNFSINRLKVLFSLNRDEAMFAKKHPDSFLIYQGHHGDTGASYANVILPACAYSEKNATYVNTEGRAQRTQKAANPPGHAKDDWKLIRALSEYLDAPLPYNTLEQVQTALQGVHPCFEFIGSVRSNVFEKITRFDPETLSQKPLDIVHTPYYMSNVICKNSQTMAACMREKLGLNPEQQKESHHA